MIKLNKVPSELYPLPFSFDSVYQILNEKDVPIGVIYVSFMEKSGVYIEWLEILTVFRGMGYLRQLFCELKNRFGVVNFECSEELLPKYKGIGCLECGIDDCTENYMLTY